MLRAALLVAIVLLIRYRHDQYRTEQLLAGSGPVPEEVLQQFFPGSPRAGTWDRHHAAQTVRDDQGTVLGFVVQTSPTCDRIVGYVGPTNVLIAFDTDYRVLGLKVLESRDTKEHLQDVVADKRFLGSYNGLTWSEAAARRDVDAVSGATLTSLAIVESISLRLGNPCPSLRFPDPPQVEELKKLFPRAASLATRPGYSAIHDVWDDQRQRLGALLRSSPACDALTGYQGPTDTLIVLDQQDRVMRVMVRSSYDNQPYVRYVQEDEYFCTLFNGKTIAELAALDLEAEQVEGVSGATMTSMTVAEALPRTARAALVRQAPTMVVAARDIGTALVLVCALVMAFSNLRGRRWVRVSYQLVLVVYLGFINGDMISQALLVGWTQSGFPWRLAPGLVLLTAAALLVPLVSRRQLYCHHICPFGAAQQLLRAASPWRVTVPARLRRVLGLLPACLLVFVLLTALLHWPVNLASIEPFDAFVFWIAGAATIVIAVVGLLAALAVPMAYCRFGCPTGAVLEYLRLNGRSDRISRRDLFAASLLLLAWLLVV